MAETFSCALILLAAGASSRMGRPKQLLPVEGRPLVRAMAETVFAAPVAPVIVVLGAHAEEILPALDGLPLRAVVNAGWAEGLGSSLRAGMKELAAVAPKVDAVIVVLADQPDVSAAHLARLIAAHAKTGRSIVASEHHGVPMPPALFSARHFPALGALRGDTGARALFQTHRREVVTVQLESANDLDTPADYENFLRPPP